MTTDDLQALSQAVTALAKPRTHRERYLVHQGGKWVTRWHVTHVPSLLDQLALAVEPSGSVESGHAVPGSRPAGRLDAIDALMLIDCEVSQWMSLLELHDRPSIAANLHALVGAGRHDQSHTLAHNARRWVTVAEVTTGWEVPARALHNTCPLCGVRGGLRVRVGDGVTSADAWACCMSCRETWDNTNIGILAEHVRVENGDESLYGEAS